MSEHLHDNLTTLYESDGCLIQRNSHEGEDVWVAFSGVGRPGDLSVNAEFVSMFDGLCFPGIFIVDKKRRWWNHGLTDEIFENISSYIEKGFRDCTLVGNSMGGTGALLMSKKLNNVRSVLAFAPQGSVKSDIIAEDRWQEHIKKIESWTAPDVSHFGSPPDDVDYRIFFGERAKKDHVHMEFIRKAFPTARIDIIELADHSVARYIRNNNELEVILQITNASVSGVRKMSVDQEPLPLNEQLVLDVARAIFSAGESGDSETWQGEKDEYRKTARRTIRRLAAFGYSIEKTT